MVGVRSAARKRKRMANAVAVESFGEMKFTLNNGNKLPAVGLGTYRIRNQADIMQTIDCALGAGYRMFDTAYVYGNESLIGNAFKTLLPKYNLEREDIFVTTKLPPSHHGGQDIVSKACTSSMTNLGLEYIDLYLIHFPGTSKLKSENPKNQELRIKTWNAVCKLYDEGLVYNVGVSNFTIKHLTDLLAVNQEVIPAVNQVEWHPYYCQKELLQFCQEKDIVVQAYSSFGGASTANYTLMQHPVVTQIAKKMEISNAQVLLLWALQQGVAVIPKSTNPDHIKQNIALNFRLSNEDLKLLGDLGENPKKYAWDPTNVY